MDLRGLTNVNIHVEGSLNNLKADVTQQITVNGNIGTITTVSGAVETLGDVSGDVITMSGNITCLDIKGKASSMSGNIKYNNRYNN
jgi:hypothetical protein